MFCNLFRLSNVQRTFNAAHKNAHSIRSCIVFYSSSNFSDESASSFRNTRVNVKFDTGTLMLKKGHLARMAESSATGSFNDTHVLITVVNKSKSSSSSFLPLTVDYLHKASATGRIPSNYHRRDMGASNYEILVSRMIDRSIRPMFASAKNFYNETQIVCNLMSYTGQDSPDVLCINAVSYALYNSSLNWNGPVGCVRVGMVDNGFVANPSLKELEKSPLNIVLTVTSSKKIIMLEAWADDVDQQIIINALEFGVKEASKIIEKIIKKSPKKISNCEEIEASENDTQDEFSFVNESFQEAYSKIYDILTDYNHDKQSRDDAISQLRNSCVGSIMKTNPTVLASPYVYTHSVLSNIFQDHVKSIARELVLNEQKRVDGRKLHESRRMECVKNLYPALHGSALFQRGQTQVLSTVTFDSQESMYKNETIATMMSPSITNFNKNFMLHYEFPGYAVNEISYKVHGRADRREVGHGSLAEKAIYSMIPDDYPFTIRAQCEVLESNGSSSMASVCATSMALMDAGVPIKKSVCGVAMGIITDIKDGNIENYEILSDISGFEDYAGDMDFKIAGTENGITAFQADFKISGLPMEIISEIINQSKNARKSILKLMDRTINKARTDNKQNQPIIKNLEVPIEQRGKLIGVGGMNLRRITSTTGVTFNPKDEANFTMFAPNSKALLKAQEIIDSLLTTQKEPVMEFGGVYKAKIVEIQPGGLMVKFYPGMKPALLPNSQLDGKKIVHGSATSYKVGEEIQVKYFGRDPVDGRMRISRKALFKTASPAKDLFDLF